MENTGETLQGQLRSRSTGAWLHQDVVKEVKRFDEFITIDWVSEELDEHRKRLLKRRNIINAAASFRTKVFSTTQTWLVLALMGIIIGLIAGCLNVITAWLVSIRLGYCSTNFYLSRAFCCWGFEEEECSAWRPWFRFELLNYMMSVLLALMFSYLSAVLVRIYAPFAAGSGISEIKCIVSGFVMRGFLGWWTLLIKSIGLPLAISSGLSVGKEGPSVHYAVCVGNSVARLFESYRKSASKSREFLTATSAAGVAVAFGSPMGGVLFSIEEISSVFQLSTIWKSYVCALIAVTTLSAINPFRTGQLVMFEVTYDTSWHYFEIPSYIILGIFGGVYGIVVSKFNKRCVAFRKKYLANYALREVFVLALLTSSICYFNEFLRLDMTESMQILFHECDENFGHELCDPNSRKIQLFLCLIFATLARMFFTIITYGCKVPAGIFVPSMAAGATFGRALGIIMEKIYEHRKDSAFFATCPDSGKCIIPGTYAFLGAAAALSGITHLTVTVVIIMFELTGAVRYIVPTMIAVAVTKSIKDHWEDIGIADQMIKFNGLPLIDSKEDFVFNAKVADAMSTSTVVLSSGENECLKLGQIKAILAETTYRAYPVIQSQGTPRPIGYVSRFDLEYMVRVNGHASDETACVFASGHSAPNQHIDFLSLVNDSPVVINSDSSLESTLDVFVKLGPRLILVEYQGLLVGLITRKDILRYEHTTHYLRSGEKPANDDLDAIIWRIMVKFGSAARKNLGRLIYNDESRFL